MARWLNSRSEQVRGQYKLNDLGKKEKGRSFKVDFVGLNDNWTDNRAPMTTSDEE